MGISGKKGGEPPPGEEFPIPEGLETCLESKRRSENCRPAWSSGPGAILPDLTNQNGKINPQVTWVRSVANEPVVGKGLEVYVFNKAAGSNGRTSRRTGSSMALIGPQIGINEAGLVAQTKWQIPDIVGIRFVGMP